MSAIPAPTSAGSIEFSAAIRDTATAMNRLASPEAVSRLNTIAQALGRIDAENSTVIFDKDDGTTEGVGDYLARAVGAFPAVVQPVKAGGPQYIGQTAAAAATVERIRRQDQADALAHAQAVAAGPNPWKAESLNQTRQAIIRKYLPQVAAQLKSGAGK